MITSCKYCLHQDYACPRCGGQVVVRIITELLSDRNIVTTSLIICDNFNCQSYGIFNKLTTDSIVVNVCSKCQETHRGWFDDFVSETYSFTPSNNERIFDMEEL